MFPLLKSVTGLSKYYLQQATTVWGGDDFDQKVADYMIAEFKKNEGVNLSADKNGYAAY